ncbi:MAG: M20/M25/M40 family metallo-hydrolase, partial [Aliifodinibius sp.]|nr:M20/M25/M40 family metallo-hydrolase [Fodinibius sp.]
MPWILVVLFFLIKPVYCQTIDSARHQPYIDIAKKIVSAALEDQRGYELLRELCQIGPRLSGSENSSKAIQWAKTKMLNMGLDLVRLQPVMVPHWVRGNVEQAKVIDTGEELSIAALGGSVGTPIDGITAEVLEVQSFEELKKRADEARGKIIFFNRPMDPTKTNTFAAYGEAVNQRVHGAKQAAKFGGVAALVRSITTKYDDVPHVGTMFYSDSFPKIPAAAISLVGADTLSNAIKENSNSKVNLKLSCQTLPNVKSYNVIGEITGLEKPQEIILIGGHFDSWDKGHGAHDDGACCIQILEVLDLFKRLNIKPKRTIRCALFINEENGLRGAKRYAQLADSASTEIHVAAIEADRGAFTPRGFTVDSD